MAEAAVPFVKRKSWESSAPPPIIDLEQFAGNYERDMSDPKQKRLAVMESDIVYKAIQQFEKRKDVPTFSTTLTTLNEQFATTSDADSGAEMKTETGDKLASSAPIAKT